MKVSLPKKGRYVVAVSGGVDSVSLLHALKDLPAVELVVAHFDHGIRPDSQTDREFVQELAETYGVPFIYKEGDLGSSAGEAVARDARYSFLHEVRRDYGAQAIITAHHQDDVLETAIINLLRGTGRKGLTSLSNRDNIERPLLAVSKRDIASYAKKHGLTWREDSTNFDTNYLRNYVRHQLLPRFTEQDRKRLGEIINGLRETNYEIDGLLAEALREQSGMDRLDRKWFVQLSHGVAMETMAAWLRTNGLRDFDSQALDRLVVAAKTAAPGKKFDVMRDMTLVMDARDMMLIRKDDMDAPATWHSRERSASQKALPRV